MIQVRICCGLDCTARGGQELIDTIENDPVMAGGVELVYVKCLEKCKDGDLAPVMEINGKLHTKMTAETLTDLLHDLIESSRAVKGGE